MIKGSEPESTVPEANIWTNTGPRRWYSFSCSIQSDCAFASCWVADVSPAIAARLTGPSSKCAPKPASLICALVPLDGGPRLELEAPHAHVVLCPCPDLVLACLAPGLPAPLQCPARRLIEGLHHVHKHEDGPGNVQGREHVAQPTIKGVITCEVAIHHVRGYVLRLRIHAR